jgi:DNA-binding SARP family transcriptional activator/tetratricopeptide (TPR) repeat protein
VEFHVLGTLRLRGACGMVEPAGRLQRVLLAVLLARANDSVGVDVLTDAMWDGKPDPRAPQRLQVHVHKLRRVLDDPARLAFGPSGYRLEVRDGELDVNRFAGLVDRAAATDNPLRRAELVRQAVDLWRGLPFDGLDVPLLADETQRLADHRLTALDLLYEAELAAGRHAAVVTELASLVREHPLRERFTWLLMTALYRDGRQVEALDVYRTARATLVEELGLEPGPELRALEQRILNGEPDQLSPARVTERAAEPASAESAPVPAQLPSNVTSFVGRQQELSQLDAMLSADADATPVVVLAGTAGVGKTALAVRWSHQRRDRFPDGQLYLDLRGYGPTDPISPEDALGGFLRALGVDGGSIPSELAERSARFRTLVDGRRMVIVLDNARTVEQVRPLLPGSASVAVLVTSRDTLAGLVARDGAQRIGLDRLPHAESVALLTRLAGHETDGPVEELVELCARLPLALRVAGELVRSRPGHGIAQLVSEIVDEQHRLDLFDSEDDPHTAVRAVFSWSYQNLAEPVARLFRMCGVHPGGHVDAYAMAAMTATDLRSARRSLATLVRAHLIDEVHAGRYTMHDLLRAYAAELAEEVDGRDLSGAAMDRLRGYYLHTAELATSLVSAHEKTGPRGDLPSIEAVSFGDYDEALRWLDNEVDNLMATADSSAPSYVTALSKTTWRYLDLRGHYDDALALHSLAIQAARAAGDRLTEADAQRFTGAMYFRTARGTESIRHTERALRLYRELGDLAGEGAAVNNLAAAYFDLNKFREVIPMCERSVELLRESGANGRLASALANLGLAYRMVGNYDAAEGCLLEAVRRAEEVENQNVLVYPVHELAYLYGDMGRPHEAIELARRAVAISRETGNRTIEGEALHSLGRIHRQLGDHEQALRRQHESFELATTMGDQIVAAMALVGLGQLHLDTGELPAATERYHQALNAVAARPLEEALAHEGLGDVKAVLGDHAGAKDHWQRALTSYVDLGVPKAAEVRAKLADARAAPSRP